MTSRERIEAALQHREPDRTPCFEYVLLSPLADRFLKRPYAGDPSNWDSVVRERGWRGAVRQNAADRVDLALLLGHDMIYATPVPPPAAPSPTSSRAVAGEPIVPDDPVERVRLRNQRAAEATSVGDDPLLIYADLKEEMRARGVDLPILAPAYAHGVWTDVDLMVAMLVDPETAHRHFGLATARALALIEKYVSLGIDQVGVGGDFAGTRTLISPGAYRQFIVPEVRTLSRRIHSAGMYAVNASDGNLWPVLDDFLLGCEVDGYLEIDMHAGMDMAALKRAYGDRVTLYGNLDCGNILSFGSPAQVCEHTTRCIEAAMGNGGHILCASNAITASVPMRNYLAVIEAYRERFGLPKLSAPE